MAELADAPDLGSGAARRGGSTPFTRTKVFCESKITFNIAGVAELADAPDLGSGAARRGGSTPFTRTKLLLEFN